MAEGEPSEVAKALLAGARASRMVVRLVHGDPFTNADVITEVQALAKTTVPFEVLPGISHAAGVSTYAGTPLGEIRTMVDVVDVAAIDFPALVTAPGSLVLTVTASELAAVRDGLLKAGMDKDIQVSVTGEGTSDIQSTSVSTLDALVDVAVGLFGRLVVTIGDAVALRPKLGWWESRPLFGWKVLVPRTKEQAGAMSAGLREWGAIPTEVPTIAVEPPRTPAQMERAIKGLVDGRYAWVVFTSANAVRAIWEKFEEHGLDARHFGGVKIACIGEATADAVRAFGIHPELLPEHEQSSVGLLESFPPFDSVLDPINRVLLPRADIATETLAAGLVERAGRSTTSPPTARCGRRRRPPRFGTPSSRAGSMRCCLPRRRRCATWSGLPASLTPVRSSPASGRRPPRPPKSWGCGWTCSRRALTCPRW